MNLEPQKFFIGLIDFFSILLPGAMLTYFLRDVAGPALLGAAAYGVLDGWEGVIVFLAASYLAGHLVFLVGAWVLDDFYDWARAHTLDRQARMLARWGTLPSWPARAFLWLVFKREKNRAVETAGAIKQEMLRPLGASASVNTFQWSKAFLAIAQGESLAMVQRFEADSKFFRSLVVVLLVLFVLWLARGEFGLAAIALVVLPFALWRYMDQRLKATNQAYWSVITLVAHEGKIKLPPAAAEGQRWTHSGGVVFRSRGGKRSYLLVEAKNDPGQWVLPKGHREPGETPAETAVREVHEETGVWAKVVGDLGTISYIADGKPLTVRFHLMRRVGRGFRTDRERCHCWRPLGEAVQRASYMETRELLRRADLAAPR